MKRQVQFLVSVLVLALLLAACAPSSVPAPAPQVPASAPAPAQPTAAVPQAPAKAAWEIEWDKTLEAAKKEGRLTAVTQFGPERARTVTEAFKSRFGIVIDWLAGPSSAMGVKILTERRAGIYSIDVGTIGHVTTYNALKPAGALEVLDKILFLPELTDPQEIKKVWRFGKLEWVDKDHTILVFIMYQQHPMIVNSQIVKPGEIKSYPDLLNPKWKGKMVIYDPTIGSGSGTTWVQITGTKTMSWDYMRKLVEQEPLITRDNRQGVEWVARGKTPIGLCLANDTIKEFLDLGSPLERVMPEEGSYTASGGNAIIMLKSAPHPNAAKLFVNWLLSKDGQTVYYKTGFQPSGRLDVSVEGVDPTLIPDPKIPYVQSYSAELIEGTADAVKMAKEIFGKLAK